MVGRLPGAADAGWPLAVPVLLAVGLIIAGLVSPGLGWADALGLAVWQGVVPATLALLLGWLMRRLITTRAFTGARIFVYVLGRGFLGTALCIFLAGTLSQSAGHAAGRGRAAVAGGALAHGLGRRGGHRHAVRGVRGLQARVAGDLVG